MSTLSDAQIAGLAQGVGLSGSTLAKSVAIALAESGGRSDVLGPPTGSGRAVGIWQIMPLKGRPSTSQLKDPNVNAQQMYKISSGGSNWKPWSAYTNGTYLRFMSRANKAAGNPDSSGTGTAEQVGLSGSISAITEFFDFISNPITWLRLGMIVAGAILVGLALMTASGLGDKAKALANVMPQGRILKAASATAKAA